MPSPAGEVAAAGTSASPLLVLEAVSRHYTPPRRHLLHRPAPVVALDGVSLSVEAGRSFGIVGESGSGKSTLARIAMALEPPTRGRVFFMGQDLGRLSRRDLRRLRPQFQMVFQDPNGSLDPRRKVGSSIAEPLPSADTDRRRRRERVADVLQAVGLDADAAARYPHAFSGGQRQRIAIARALVTNPRLIVADEPVSALDVSVQAQILNLLRDLTRDRGLTLLLISHDLAVVENVCERIAVMRHGRIVEQGDAQSVLARPADAYTRLLVEAATQEAWAPV